MQTYVTLWKYLHNATQMPTQRKKAWLQWSVVLSQPCCGDTVCFYMKAKAALYSAFWKWR